ncbi:unnamed protein product [Linum trigynum]|uniref:Gnk2-homologous domain-containing protein n=1 Tax=Linum trigynum TaxID=586398 RepID=A0AAV2CBX5_9ROSI
MNLSLQKLLTLVVVVVAAAAGTLIEETSAAPNCLGTGASADFEAYKAHVLDELANVTPTMEGYSYSTKFPPPGSTAAPEAVYGSASCTPDVGDSACASCLIGAKLSLAQSCAFALYGAVTLPQCTMSFIAVVE